MFDTVLYSAMIAHGQAWIVMLEFSYFAANLQNVNSLSEFNTYFVYKPRSSYEKGTISSCFGLSLLGICNIHSTRDLALQFTASKISIVPFRHVSV